MKYKTGKLFKAKNKSSSYMAERLVKEKSGLKNTSKKDTSADIAKNSYDYSHIDWDEENLKVPPIATKIVKMKIVMSEKGKPSRVSFD
jgi:hypothetical protein